MDTLLTLIDNKIFIATVSIFMGIIITFITQKWINKRSIFAYTVFHNLIGVSTEDPTYGSVKVTWNNDPVPHLFLSTISLTNSSSNDFESVIVRVHTTNTKLLTENCMLEGMTRKVDFSDDFDEKIKVPNGGAPSINQIELYECQREYQIPIINRGQKINFQYLNAALSNEQPTIQIEILHKGVKCEFQVPKMEILGVPQQTAVWIGTLIGIFAIGMIILFVENLIIAVSLAFFMGWITLIPGAYTIKLFRNLKRLLFD
jgi:hypothetical protein